MSIRNTRCSRSAHFLGTLRRASSFRLGDRGAVEGSRRLHGPRFREALPTDEGRRAVPEGMGEFEHVCRDFTIN
jgi:hypothetical protein